MGRLALSQVVTGLVLVEGSGAARTQAQVWFSARVARYESDGPF